MRFFRAVVNAFGQKSLTFEVAIKRTPDFGVRSARHSGLNIGGVRIPHPHYHAHIKKCSSRYTLFSTSEEPGIVLLGLILKLFEIAI